MLLPGTPSRARRSVGQPSHDPWIPHRGQAKGWQEIADGLNARGVRRDRGLPFSGAWLRRQIYSVALWSVHERECVQASGPGSGNVEELPDWFPVGRVVGRHGGWRRVRSSQSERAPSQR